MYCRNCSNEIIELDTPCSACGKHPLAKNNYCSKCARPTTYREVMCIRCSEDLTIKPEISIDDNSESKKNVLYKSSDEKIFFGVISGISHKLRVQRNVIRFFVLFLSFLFIKFAVTFTTLYLLCTFICTSRPTKLY